MNMRSKGGRKARSSAIICNTRAIKVKERTSKTRMSERIRRYSSRRKK
jgi:hypothetical protein